MNNQTKGALLAHGPLGLFLSSTTPIPDPITPESVHELVRLAALNAETLERFEVALHSALMLWAADTSTPSTGPARTPDSVEQRVRDAMARVERAVSARTNVVLEAARLHAAAVPQQAQLLEVRDEDPELTKVLEELDELTINFGPRDRSIQVLLKHLRLAQMRAQSESHLARVETRRADDCAQRAQLAEAQLREVSAARDIDIDIARTNADKAAARIRELEAERDRERSEAEKARGEAVVARAFLKDTRATLAETRAQLARLREAAERYSASVDAWFSDKDSDRMALGEKRRAAGAALEAALSTPGPTLAEIRRAASDFREIRPSVDGDLDAAVDRAQAEGRVLDLRALVRLCMDPQVDTLIYAITEAGAVFLFSETCVRKEVAEIRRAAQVEVLREMAGNLTQGWASEWVAGWLRQRANDLEAGRE